MREIISDVDRWLAERKKVALATVIETWGSAPRGVGAKMALTPEGQLSGSVSGGCVEGAVFEAGVETLQTGEPQLLSFGVADETAWDVGLACGGQIQVFVEALDNETFHPARHWLHEENTGAVATVVSGPAHLLGKKLLLSDEGQQTATLPGALADQVLPAVKQAMTDGAPKRFALEGEPDVEFFVDVLMPPDTLVLVGGVHIAVALTTIAKAVGYRTIVIDPRRAFGSQERFPDVDRLISAWPDEAFKEVRLNSATAVAMLTHDPKIDDPALKAVLSKSVFYVGALGSSNTHARRKRRLLDDGVAPELVERIHSPIGLDINASTPEEIAVAVMAEVVAARRQPATLHKQYAFNVAGEL